MRAKLATGAVLFTNQTKILRWWTCSCGVQLATIYVTAWSFSFQIAGKENIYVSFMDCYCAVSTKQFNEKVKSVRDHLLQFLRW